MARGVNKVILMGNVGQDPEVRVLPSGAIVANLSLATNEPVKNRETGEYFDRVEWHNLVAWGGHAEVLRDYVKKGSKIFVIGKNQTRSWDDRATGDKRYRTEVFIRELELLTFPSHDSNSHGYGNGHKNGNGNGLAHSNGTGRSSSNGYSSRDGHGNGNQRHVQPDEPDEHDDSDDFTRSSLEASDIPF